MESNVMAGRALFGCLQLPDGQRRCAIFLVHEKVTQGSSKSAEYRLELVVYLNLWLRHFVAGSCYSIFYMLHTLILALIGRSRLS